MWPKPYFIPAKKIMPKNITNSLIAFGKQRLCIRRRQGLNPKHLYTSLMCYLGTLKASRHFGFKTNAEKNLLRQQQLETDCTLLSYISLLPLSANSLHVSFREFLICQFLSQVLGSLRQNMHRRQTFKLMNTSFDLSTCSTCQHKLKFAIASNHNLLTAFLGAVLNKLG